MQDPIFGAFAVCLDDATGELRLVGEALPEVVVRRAQGTQLEVHVPIGSRDADRLTMTIGGSAARLAPAKGFLTRTSYRVDVHHDKVHYRLIPVTLGESRLLRDGVALGVFTSTGDGAVTAEWQDAAGQEPQDAAVGYSLAASFGTGAEPMWKLTLDAALALFS
ncbi:hypothetical protein [Streptomyces abyssomicinicus]|uniref:hypothetical protein n=1 Tax=Streptomyces abyssomicinicus TaxID=574929 RepID=UPI001FE83DA2|nr:hypothetical protein [Streptomyces abyssomicinicus]